MALMDLKRGKVVKYNNDPYVIVWSQFKRKEAQKPVMKTKLKNLKSGAVLDKTFNDGEKFEFADVMYAKVQFLYSDGETSHFMNEQNYEQFEMQNELIAADMPYLLDGVTVTGVMYEGNIISIILPPKMVFEVKETTPGVKGDTVSGGKKPAKLETGIKVNVPLFINEGDKVRINTETGDYVERA